MQQLHVSVGLAPKTSQDSNRPSSAASGPAPDSPRVARCHTRLHPRRWSTRPLHATHFALLPLALACSTPLPTPSPTALPRSPLVAVETHGAGQLFVKPDHGLGRYDDLMVRHVGFRYREGEARLREREEDQIVDMLVTAIEGARTEPIGLAADPGPCVLSVDFFVKDLELAEPLAPAGAASEFRTSLGRATLILELRDSLTDETLARFVERRQLGGGWWTGHDDERLDRLARAIGFAVRDMGRQVHRLTHPAREATGDGVCGGALTKVALGSR